MGRAHMVDVGDKAQTSREAVAVGALLMDANTLEVILKGSASKGDVLGIARVAGIMASKKTGDLIPLCHPISLTHVSVEFAAAPSLSEARLWIRATVRCQGQTGVEMEALTAVQIAALTVYDMCKAIDRTMIIESTLLLHKRGGKHGDFCHPSLRLPELNWR